MPHVRAVVVLAIALAARTVTVGAEGSSPAAARDCAVSVTNRADCVVTIDREHPSSPLPIVMHRGKVMTIRVNKRPLDDVKADATFTDIATPDPSAALFAALLPILPNVRVDEKLTLTGQETFLTNLAPADTPKAPDPTGPILEELQRIDAEQRVVTTVLGASKGRIDTAKEALKAFRTLTHDFWVAHTPELASEMHKVNDSLTAAAGSNAALGEVAGLHEAMTAVTKRYAALFANTQAVNPTKLQALGVMLSDVAANQALIEGSSASVAAAGASARETAKAIGEMIPSTSADAHGLLFFEKSFTDAGARGGRSVSVKLKQQDVISNDATDLATVTASWSSTRLSVSGGVVFSTAMPSRTFANSAAIVNGEPQMNGDKVNTVITESQTFPQVIPMALTHVLLWEAARYDQRFAAHGTVGIGVNPYSKTADFALGGTFSYRALMFSVLERLGRDSRLGGGLKVGQSLGGDPPDLPVENFWKWDHWNIAVSAKIF
jgi:hypothetical protein